MAFIFIFSRRKAIWILKFHSWDFFLQASVLALDLSKLQRSSACCDQFSDLRCSQHYLSLPTCTGSKVRWTQRAIIATLRKAQQITSYYAARFYKHAGTHARYIHWEPSEAPCGGWGLAQWCLNHLIAQTKLNTEVGKVGEVRLTEGSTDHPNKNVNNDSGVDYSVILGHTIKKAAFGTVWN